MSSQATDQKKNYKSTLNLPQTAFPMEAKLVTNEPKRLAMWEETHLYGRIQTDRASRGRGEWLLHDGPPFANGDIHIGHVINHVLKDVVLRFRTLQGYRAPYVPGWDCHGLPIEHKIQQELGPKLREMSAPQVRQRCHDYAQKYIDVQREQIKRLGVLGDWKKPYVTMSPSYEASQLEVFAKFVQAGLVFKKLRPVPWSTSNNTALAEHELEYKDVDDPSIYVEFPAADAAKVARVFGREAHEPWNFLVWTTTPWTLPANLAIAVHPEHRYLAVRYRRDNQHRVGVVLDALMDKVFAGRKGVEGAEMIGQATGADLVAAAVEYRHPFIERTGKLLAAMYVTTTDGTGLVHTAPGHGVEDYATGQAHGLPPYTPVQGNGRYDDTAPEWLVGKTVWEANPLIVDRLKSDGHLFDVRTIRHSYPHDWRSKQPVIQRAAEQWFIAMNKPFNAPGDPPHLPPTSLRWRAKIVVGFDWRSPETEEQQGMSDARARLIESIASAKSCPIGEVAHLPVESPHLVLDEHDMARLSNEGRAVVEYLKQVASSVIFTPRWGQNRLRGMLESRPDWSISRQRFWGLPIPVFYNPAGEPLLTPESVRAVAERFRERGSDVWYTLSPSELLGENFSYPPGFDPATLRKEQDTFDVGFDSGTSWHSVLYGNEDLKFPADLYLEGSDQHRLWFQLSLLASLGATGQPPFKQVLTHGFVVKPDGTKVSKSDKEYVTATKEINTHGADLLRLWCCSVDYENDIPASPAAIKEFGDKYRKIRNTLRYLLSNLYDFDPHADGAAIVPNSLDGWITDRLDSLIDEVAAAYDSYQLHRAFRLLHDFCSVDISAIYGNAMKDRLYCESPTSPLRRRCQATMHRLALALTKLLSPMLVFTADEAWEHIPHKPLEESDLPSVHLALLPEKSALAASDSDRVMWRVAMELRESALQQLDELKKTRGLNKSLDARLMYHFGPTDSRRSLFEEWGVDAEDLLSAGEHQILEVGQPGEPMVRVIDLRDELPAACARCWKRRSDVGQQADHPDLCNRCAAAVRAASR